MSYGQLDSNHERNRRVSEISVAFGGALVSYQGDKEEFTLMTQRALRHLLGQPPALDRWCREHHTECDKVHDHAAEGRNALLFFLLEAMECDPKLAESLAEVLYGFRMNPEVLKPPLREAALRQTKPPPAPLQPQACTASSVESFGNAHRLLIR